MSMTEEEWVKLEREELERERSPEGLAYQLTVYGDGSRRMFEHIVHAVHKLPDEVWDFAPSIDPVQAASGRGSRPRSRGTKRANWSHADGSWLRWTRPGSETTRQRWRRAAGRWSNVWRAGAARR